MTQMQQASITVRYLQMLPVEICILSFSLAFAKKYSKVKVIIIEPTVPIKRPNTNGEYVKKYTITSKIIPYM